MLLITITQTPPAAHCPVRIPAGASFDPDKTLCIAAAYSNPQNWRSRRALFEQFRAYMATLPNVRLFVGEIAYGNDPFQVTSASNHDDLQLRAPQILWHKENILDLVITRKFPVGWQYGAYVDGDFHFSRTDMAAATIKQLQSHGWVQMFSSYSNMSADHHILSSMPSFAYCRSKGKPCLPPFPPGCGYADVGACGGAWAFRRHAYEAVGGLIDFCVTGCYDDKTEVFTRRGWIPFANLTLNDEVFSLSPSKVAEWQPVTKLYRYRYTGPMRQFKSEAVDLLVTPNHRMVYEKRNCIYFEKAEEFNRPKSSRSVPKSQTWAGRMPSTIPVDVTIEDWVAFVGIWLAEGWTYLATDKETGGHHYRIGISQKQGNKYCRISALLKKFPISWHEDERGFVGNHKELFTYLRGLGSRSWDKHIPTDIKELPSHILEIFLKWYMLGDGNVDQAKKTNHTDSWRMFTTSAKLRDGLLEVFIKTGRWGAYRVRQPRTAQPLKSGRAITSRRVGYDIWVHRSHNFHIKSRHLSEVEYNGEVFCCETPHHTLLVRRNQKMIWCGNSGDWHMAFGLVGAPDLHPEMKSCGPGYVGAIKAWQARAAAAGNKTVGCVDAHGLHYWHGPLPDRAYGTRWNILRDHRYDPGHDVFRTHDGVVQLMAAKQAMGDGILKYFAARNEDADG